MVVGLVGCGVWGANVLRDLRQLGAEVRVVARSAESVARARDGGAAMITSELGGLGDVDAIVVVTPIPTHAEVVEQALSLHVPVYVEKPLCDDSGAAVELARLGRGQLFVMDKWRYHPGVLELARIARTGSLGSVQGLRTVRVQSVNRHEEDAVWVLAPHDLVIALEVLGDVPRSRAASGVWDDGHLVTLHALLDTDAGWHALQLSERAAVIERRIELHCDGGVAVLADGWADHLLLYRGNGLAPERVEATGDLPLLAELRAFLEFVAGGPPPKSSAEEGAAVVATIAQLRALAA